MTPAAIVDEIRDARDDFHRLVDEATTADLRKPSNGTKWTNDQLLFHMLFGYLVVRNLLWLVRGFSILPDGYARRFAHASTPPLDRSTSSTTSAHSAAPGYSGTAVWNASWTESLRASPEPSNAPPTSSWPAGCTSRSTGIRTSATT